MAWAQHNVHFATRNSDTLNQEDAFVRNKANAEAMLKKAESVNLANLVYQKHVAAYKNGLEDNNELWWRKAYNQIDENAYIYRPVSMSWPNKKQGLQQNILFPLSPYNRKTVSCSRSWLA